MIMENYTNYDTKGEKNIKQKQTWYGHKNNANIRIIYVYIYI